MKQFKQLITLFFLIFTSLSFAQTGIVSGTIMDSEFNDVLPYANVVVKGTTKGTTTDFDGKYALELAEGTYTIQYSFVGYETKEITDVIVKANEEVIVDVSIGPANSLEEVVLTSSSKRNTENAVLNLQKKSVMLMDGLSAQTIKKTGASNAASAVKSVPGVSIQGGKYVYVRGLGDRYTKSILNGIDIPGLDPDRNTIQMDIFPTNIIDNVIVIKSAAAEYPADFTGGVVDIITKDFPSKAEYSISAGAGYNSAMHFNDNYLTYSGSKSDFLGYDSGKRDLPINRYQPIPGTFNNSTVLTTLTRRFDSELAAKNDTSGMNFDFGFTAGNQYDLGKNKIGYIASLSYKNNTTFYGDRIDGNYTKDENNSNNNDLLATRLTNGDEGINSIVLNGLAGIVFKTDKSKYKANVLHIQNGESSAGFYLQKLAQGGGNAGFENIQKDALLYTERSITNVLFNGDHKLTDNLDLDWKFSPTFTKVLDKDHRITPLEQNQNGNFSISPSTSSFPIRIWRTLQEEAWNGKVDLVNKYKLFDKAAKFKFGGSYSFKYRDFSTDQYLFTSTTLNVEDGNADNLLAEENLWTTTNQSGTFLNFGQAFQPANSYEGEQNIGALYASNEFNISEKLKAIVGLRTELYKTFYTGQNQAGDEVFDGEKILDEYDFFPSANLIYAVTDNTNVRASYSRTTARPSFKEASNIQIFDPITNRTFIGNGFGNEFYDAVKPSYVSNFDVRYEWFREEGQMIAISGFYKDFKDPIESVFFPFSPDQLTVANLGNAKVYGVELELRQNLGFITDGLRNLKFKANASLIESELEMAETEYQRRLLAARDGQTIDRTRQLQGQSPFLLNLGFDYSNDNLGLRSGLFYNVQGKALEVVGTGIVPDVYTQPFNSLNFTLNKEFGESKKSSIDLKVTNILGDKRESDYESYNTDNQTFSLRNPGTEISLGYSYKF